METEQINLVETITQTINNLFSNLFSSIDNSLYSILDDLLFISPDIMSSSTFGKILGTSDTNGLILICNSLILGFVLYYLCNLMLSYFTCSKTQSPVQFVFKLMLCLLAINFSEFIIERILSLFSVLSLSIRELGELVFNESICLSSFIEKFNSTVYFEEGGFNVFSLNGLIKSFISISFLNLSISYSVRYIMAKVFILLTPFAFMSLTNNNTSWIFKSWFKLLLSLLMLQIFVPLILLVSLSLNVSSSNLFSQIIYLGCVYSLIKCNTFIKDFMGGLSTDISNGFSGLKNFISG